eukprot:COSAG02_NODE_23456_length_718_cov_1.092084_1_plen_20_part_10
MTIPYTLLYMYLPTLPYTTV